MKQTKTQQIRRLKRLHNKAKYTGFPLNTAKNLRNIFLFKLNLLSLQCD